jgi:archaeal type IV pilus assembly protein PilA
MPGQEPAVSPVIGVLLMLTLTLIIAAIVNSYAGGLMETEPKAPAATLQVKYFQDGTGMEIRHISGDPLPTSQVKLVVRSSETMGRSAGQYTSEINKTYITNSTGTQSWMNGITSMKPGEVYYMLGNRVSGNLTHLQDGIGDQSYWINTTENLGNTFYLEVYYRNTMISRNEVLIE